MLAVFDLVAPVYVGVRVSVAVNVMDHDVVFEELRSRVKVPVAVAEAVPVRVAVFVAVALSVIVWKRECVGECRDVVCSADRVSVAVSRVRLFDTVVSPVNVERVHASSLGVFVVEVDAVNDDNV